MIHIYIGANPEGKDARAVEVLKRSIKHRTMATVSFTEIGDGTGGTGFSCARYAIPQYHHTRYAIYLDADMLVLGDIEELYEYRREGQWVSSETFPKGSSAVSVIDCNLELPMPVNEKPFYYDKQLKRCGILHPDIPEAWNCRNYENDGTKLIHYTDRSKQPWNHPPTREIDALWLFHEAAL